MFGECSAAWSESAAAAPAVAGHEFFAENQNFFPRGPEATVRKKQNAKEDDMKKVDLIISVPWGSG